MRRSIGLALTILCLASVASGQDEGARYEGHYVLEGTEDAARERIRRALEPAIASVPFLFRSIAEERLRSRFQVIRAIDIALPEDRIRVRYIGPRGRTLDSRRGYPTAIETEDGGEAQMTQLFRDGHLEQIFEGEQGRLYRVLELNEDGSRLTATTILTGDRLPEPVRITHPYRRR